MHRTKEIYTYPHNCIINNSDLVMNFDNLNYSNYSSIPKNYIEDHIIETVKNKFYDSIKKEMLSNIKKTYLYNLLINQELIY